MHIQKRFPPLDLNKGLMEYEGIHLPKAIEVFEKKKKQVEEFEKLVENQNMESIGRDLITIL